MHHGAAAGRVRKPLLKRMKAKLTPAMKEKSSVTALCLEAVPGQGKADAVNHRCDGKWINMPAATFVERIKNCALGLASLGIRPGDRVALRSENRPEGSIVDLAILSLGAINVPIYTTQAVEQIEYILSDSGAKAIFISNRRLYKHAYPALANRQLDLLIFFDSEVASDIERSLPLDQLEENGKQHAAERPD